MNEDRSMLIDAQWDRLSLLLSGQAHSPSTTAKHTRLFVEAVLWRARCGVAWRDLPVERFSPSTPAPLGQHHTGAHLPGT
ncbi:MAG: transposase [Janthinobacterium lividum]